MADTWEKRKIRENKLAILKADEQIKRLESGAGKPRLQAKVLTEAEQEAKVRANYEKHMQKTKADIAYWKKRQEVGAVDKAIALEMEILDGQLSGKYDPFASRRTIGWAKTVKTGSSGMSAEKSVNSGSSGSVAQKSVLSGTGASGSSEVLSQNSSGVVSLEVFEKMVKDKDAEREAALKECKTMALHLVKIKEKEAVERYISAGYDGFQY